MWWVKWWVAMSGKKGFTAVSVRAAPPGRHADADCKGLYLDADESGARRWLFRFQLDGKRREMGLGSAGRDGVSLADARRLAGEARQLVLAGRDPLEARREAEEAAEAAEAARVAEEARPTFGAVADALIETMRPSWRNLKHGRQWEATLGAREPDWGKVKDATAHELYWRALQDMRAKPVADVTLEDVLAVLRPVWLTLPETARRLRSRLEIVFDAAGAQGLRTGENPARLRGNLSHLLPKVPKLSRGHHAAMAYRDVPAFMTELRERDAVAARALEFAILTVARTGEVLGARWSEIDLSERLWRLPPHRMKGGKEHAVPLVPRAIEILEEMAQLRADHKADGFIFPGQKRDRPLSAMALEMVLRRMGVKAKGVTVHGFRSGFRDFAGNETEFPREVAEECMSHTVGNSVERAYRRGAAIEKRRALLTVWAEHCQPSEPAGNVVPLRRG
jgi:integrase